jgi:hypothetical protein
VIILKIEMPLQTMERLMEFFAIRKIHVDSLYMHGVAGGEATRLINCLVEKDRILYTKNMLSKIRGILELQLLENRETNTIKHGS